MLELAELIGLRRDGLDELADLFDAALQSGRAIQTISFSLCAPTLHVLAQTQGFAPAGLGGKEGK
ncbi:MULTISPECIES: hypothetical protein [Rhizobium]|uniref:Uncharacterized protein n=1 Tax=Rhizobium paranaense TaxID=1650438 RepID=A0A7W8XYP5_9HYPH|nr:hypothetical protein [Rhizobium paranaense]